jgi:tellurite resistance protein
MVKIDKIKSVIIFPLEIKSETIANENYVFAQLFLLLAVSTSASGKVNVDVERAQIIHWIGSNKSLSATEKVRLAAYLEWLFIEKPVVGNVKKKIQSFSATQKETFVSLLIRVAGSDGNIEPSEIKMLQKIYSLLNLDPERLFSDIHKYQSDTTSESNVSEASATTDTVELDSKKIRKKIEETKKVNVLLTGVFSEKEDDEKKIETKKPPKVKNIAGLDDLHSSLVFELLKKPVWKRNEFEAICTEKGLFADGALEIVNTASYDLMDAPLLEDDDDITVNTEIAEQLSKK